MNKPQPNTSVFDPLQKCDQIIPKISNKEIAVDKTLNTESLKKLKNIIRVLFSL